MEYISSKKAAEAWGVNIRMVQQYCKDSRISGAQKMGNVWFVPADASKPGDPRKRKEDTSQSAFFTLPKKCPLIITTTIYNRPGSADDVTEILASDAEAQTLFSAQLAYFRGETDKAKDLALKLVNNTKRPDVRAGGAFVLCLCAMYDGDVSGWISARSIVLGLPCTDAEQAAVRDFQIGSIDSGLYDEKGFPDWLREGDFTVLPSDCYPLARFIYLKMLLLTEGAPRVSSICGPLISQSRMEGALLSEIYCILLAAIGYHDTGMFDKAAKLLDIAIAKALPDRLYSPLIEYRNEFGILLDERLTAADKNAAADIRRLHKRLIEGWGILCGKVRGLAYSTELTQRERHAAKLVAWGLSNAEIASRMNLSVNTVKRYICSAVAKTGAANRAELVNYILLREIN